MELFENELFICIKMDLVLKTQNGLYTIKPKKKQKKHSSYA